MRPEHIAGLTYIIQLHNLPQNLDPLNNNEHALLLKLTLEIEDSWDYYKSERLIISRITPLTPKQGGYCTEFAEPDKFKAWRACITLTAATTGCQLLRETLT